MPPDTLPLHAIVTPTHPHRAKYTDGPIEVDDDRHPGKTMRRHDRSIVPAQRFQIIAIDHTTREADLQDLAGGEIVTTSLDHLTPW